MMKVLLSFLLVVTTFFSAYATHNRAGEITFKYIGGLTYEITVITYTRFTSPPSNSNNADRCEIEIRFGDGTIDTIARTNGNASNTCLHSGVMVANDIKRNEYKTQHTYPGPFNYTISVEDPNRNANIENIEGSVNIPFYIETMIGIGEINHSPDLVNPPIDEGCVGIPYFHNPGAVDLDGDSLVYSLQVCRGAGGDPIPQYIDPDEVIPGNTNNISIDASTGTVTWDSPKKQGEYNICIRIDEYRDGILVGSILRDMQITIGVCNNNPPVIEELNEICVTAGDAITVPIVATDEDGDVITLTASGTPLVVADSPAEFNGGQQAQNDSIVQADFVWETNCTHVQKQPYQVVFKAQDNHRFANLVDYEELLIRVIAPAPENTQAAAAGNSIELSWNPSICSNASGYKVYRRVDSIGFIPDTCQTGVPSDIGYIQIGTIESPLITSFIDDDNGKGLIHGQKYCYLVVACFPDGAQSYATLEFCEELKKDVPVTTRVSVNTTSVNNGSDTITWAKPTELDLVQYPGPYLYKIYRSFDDNFAAAQLIGTTATNNDLLLTDTVFVDNGINTLEEQYYYHIELISLHNANSETVTGRSHSASSVFLSSTPSDNKLTLTWDADVPWTNNQYEVYKFSNHPDSLDSAYILAVVNEPTFVDSGLTNLIPYRYFVRSIGSYSVSGFIDPIVNNSQIHTGIPIDLEPPCPPQLPYIESDCELGENFIRWGNPNNFCRGVDDVIGYNIYFSPVLGGPMELLEYIPERGDTSRTFAGLVESVAGCYAITAVDSFQNESDFSEALCVDNCPIYELPNVFTPGGDGTNDFMIPFPYRHVESIDLEIFNRWGKKVFETTDPNIKWDGTDEDDQQLDNGVYYYVCTVNEIRLTGVVPRTIKGYIHILNQKDFIPSGN